MFKAKMTCHPLFTRGEIDRRVFGSFVEHMGRVIYSGIYEPGHPAADAAGLRSDVLHAVREMGVSCVRYPGGNFVSNYHWEDGVGPKEKRPRRRELAWRSIETNEFGTHEFMDWADKAKVQPMLTVNLGTQGIENALNYLEYVNMPAGTKYSDLRAEHGFSEPYGAKMWCLGNEMDGTWQLGHKTATEYGRLAAETGRAMKLLDPSIQLIACGSAKSDMPTYPAWDEEVIHHVYGIADYIGLHQYYGGQQLGTAAFLAQSEDFERYVDAIRSVIRVEQARQRSRIPMHISVDEWGVWAMPSEAVTQEVDAAPWQIAPSISEQIYTMEDALLFASMLMTIVRNADIVKIGCQSLIANISACIMTQRGGGMWKQTIYYPFRALANHARGVVLNTPCDAPVYEAGNLRAAMADTLAVWNRDESEIALFAVNRSDSEEAEITLDLQGFEGRGVIGSEVLAADDRKMTNQFDHNAVVPQEGEAALRGNTLTFKLPPLAFGMVRVGV